MKSLLNRIDWTVGLFISITLLISIFIVPWYAYHYGVSWPILVFSLIYAALTNLSITAGYHRHFSHRSYDVHPILKVFYLLVGASAFQGSALKWSADHRTHHKHVDTNDDPYNINQGFWYAHMGWLYLNDVTNTKPKAPDLEKDWMISFQHRHFVSIAIVMGFIFPALVGWCLGSLLAGFLIGGVLRIAVTQQTTFFINSLCHTFGKQTYSLEYTARDCFWVALLTHGEGYHNFHHKFPYDYRNAIRWYQWDPTRWTIDLLAKFGLASQLKTVSKDKILKAKLQVESLTIASKGYEIPIIERIQERLVANLASIEQLKHNYRQLKKDIRAHTLSAMEALNKKKLLRIEIKLRRIEFNALRKEWRVYLKAPMLST